MDTKNQTIKQNKDQTQKPQAQWEQQQKVNKQHLNHLRTGTIIGHMVAQMHFTCQIVATRFSC